MKRLGSRDGSAVKSTDSSFSGPKSILSTHTALSQMSVTPSSNIHTDIHAGQTPMDIGKQGRRGKERATGFQVLTHPKQIKKTNNNKCSCDCKVIKSSTLVVGCKLVQQLRKSV